MKTTYFNNISIYFYQFLFIFINFFLFPYYISAQVESKPLQETGIGVSNQNQNYNFNMGYRFTADNDGDVTQLGGRWKAGIVHTVRLYAYPAGTLLAQVNVTGSMSWSYAAITPVSITAGSQYVVAVRLDGQSSGVNTTFSTPVTSGGITITNSTYLSASNAMPTNSITTIMYGQADITFSYTPCTYAGDITADNYQINTGDSTNLYASNTVGNIQWQSSLDSIVFTDIPGATNDTINSGPLTVTTFFRTYVTGGSCGPDTSRVVKITVVNPEYPLQYTGLGITSQNQNWNYNMGYRFKPSTGGNVTELGGRWKNGIVHTVRLYNFSTGAVLAQANVTGSINWSYTSITPVTLSADSQYVVAVRLDAQSSGVSTNFTTPVVSGNVTINNSSYLINSNSMPTNVITNIMYGQADIRFESCAFAGDVSATAAEVCPGDSTTVNVTDNIGTIQWQSSSDNITFTDIPGEVGSVLNTGPLLAKRYYRTYITGGGCGSDTSNVDSVAVTGPGGTPGLWTANKDNDWNTPCNWDNAVVPVNGDSAIIPPLVSIPVNIPEISLKYLEMNNSGGIGLTNKMTITEKLVLTAGNINIGSDTLLLAASAIITGGVSTSYIQVDGAGRVRKNYSIADGSTFTFPIGDVNDYSRVTLDLNTGSTLGADPFITINITDAIHPNIGNPGNYITRYWTINANDITTPDFDITCQYVDADIVGTESTINTHKFNASTGWTQYNATNAATNTLSGNNITSFGDFSGSDAITIISTQTGNWDAGATWLGGFVPDTINNVQVQPLHTVSLVADTIINNIEISASGTLNVAGNKLSVKGSFTINGSYDGTGEIVFRGSSSQTIAGSGTTFNNLTINNTGGVNITSGAYNLTGTLTLTKGAFNTNNAFTLISNASGTARIARITGGSITGNITMQRYLTTGPNSWRFLSSPVSGRTLADWNDNFAMSGFPGSDDPGFSFTSIYTYDETVLGTLDNGYTPPSDISDPITVGKGYWAYLGPLALTFDVTGAANTGNKSLPVTYTNDPGQPASEDGWNMVGNPYPSTIDWDATGWSKTNINPTIYIYKNDGSYASYPTGGPGLNGGSRYIASSQAFWIQTNGTSPALSANESIKANPDQTFLKTSDSQSLYDYIMITVTGNGFSDETAIRFIPGATAGIDNYDAYKLNNDPYSQIPNISSLVDTFDLAINSIAQITQELSFPIRVTVGATGSYTINTAGVYNIASDDICVTLEDLQTGVITDLKTDSTYTFTISDTTTAPRFLIHFNTVNAVFNVNKSVVTEGENIQFNNTSTGAVSYSWDFGDGSPADNSTNPGHIYNSEGTYNVTLAASNINCSDTYSYQITVLDAPVSSNSQSPPGTQEQSSIVILTSKDGAYIEFNFDQVTNLNIAVYNLLGQKVTADNNIRVKQDRIRLDLPDKVRGVYFIKIETDAKIITRKFVMH